MTANLEYPFNYFVDYFKKKHPPFIGKILSFFPNVTWYYFFITGVFHKAYSWIDYRLHISYATQGKWNLFGSVPLTYY